MTEPAVNKGSSPTLTVACKLPHGLWLRLYDMRPQTEPVLGGGTRETTVAEVRGDVVRINGYLHPQDSARDTRVLAPSGLASATGRPGWALTHGVSRKFFEEWLSQNKDLPAIRNGLIKAHESTSYLEEFAKEHIKQPNGLEPIDPKNPPRVGRFKVEKYKQDDEGVAA